MSSTSFQHIVLAGNIGAGKTTLTRLLSRRYSWRSYYERVDDNPFLEDFYSDMARWAFSLQAFFLAHRVEDHRLIAERQESAVQDRSLQEDALIFARNLHEMGHMSDREWETYRRLYLQALALLRPPDLIVYLRRSLEGLQANIEQRGRDFELNIPADYLMRLNRFYEDWIASETVPTLIVEADRVNYLEKDSDREHLYAQFENALGQGDLFSEPAPRPEDPRFEFHSRGVQSLLGQAGLSG